MAWQWVQSFFCDCEFLSTSFLGWTQSSFLQIFFSITVHPVFPPELYVALWRRLLPQKSKITPANLHVQFFLVRPFESPSVCMHGQGILSQTECAASGPASMVRTRQGLNYYLIIICKKVVQAVSLGPAPLNVTINSGTFFAGFLFKGEENEEKMKENYVWHEGGRHSRHRGHRGVGPPPLNRTSTHARFWCADVRARPPLPGVGLFSPGGTRGSAASYGQGWGGQRQKPVLAEGQFKKTHSNHNPPEASDLPPVLPPPHLKIPVLGPSPTQTTPECPVLVCKIGIVQNSNTSETLA